MDFKPPTPDEYSTLASKNAHRRPSKITVTVVGDGGAPVRLPIVLGNPTGACDLPPGAKAALAWEHTVAITLQTAADAPDAQRNLAMDAVLYPSAVELDAWLERWPGLPARIVEELKKKIGAKMSALDEPAFDDVPPAAIAATLVASPRALWRRVNLQEEKLAIAIEPPAAAAWEFFTAEAKKDGVKRWPVVRTLVESCVRSVVRLAGTRPSATEPGELEAVYEEMAVTEMVKRWPGTVLLAVQLITELVGLAAEVELGGW